MSVFDIYGKLIDNDAVGGGIVDATKVKAYQQFWFTGADSSKFGTVGQVAPVNKGERVFWNGSFATQGSYTTPRMLSKLPNADSIYDTSVTIGDALTADEDGGYAATAEGAVFFPALFQSGSTIEDYIANGTYLGGGKWFITNAPNVDSYYIRNFPENYTVNTPPSPLTLCGIMENFIPMIGKKVAVLGDSLTEQSEMIGRTSDDYGFRAGTFDGDGWFTRIARKYNMTYKVHGYGMQWWYVTSERPNGGVKAVNSLIESGYNPDYIVLEYGTNDIWSGSLGEATDTADAAATSTVGAMRYCIETLQEQLPSAKIIVVMPCMRNDSTEKQNTYYELVKPILREYGVRCVDMLGNTGIVASMMNPDGVHLAISATGGGYDNTTEAVARYSRCLEVEMLRL